MFPKIVKLNDVFQTNVDWNTYDAGALKVIKEHALKQFELAYTMQSNLSKQVSEHSRYMDNNVFVVNFNFHALKYAYDFLISDTRTKWKFRWVKRFPFNSGETSSRIRRLTSLRSEFIII